MTGLVFLVALFGLLEPGLSAVVHTPALKATLLARGEQAVALASTGSESHDSSTGNEPKEVTINLSSGVLMACCVSVSMVLGATVVLFMPEVGPPPRAMAFSFSLAAGVMIAIAVELLHPRQFKLAFAWFPFLIFFGGFLSCAAICKLADCFAQMGSTEKAEKDETGAQEAAPENNDEDRKTRFRLTLLLFVSLTLHHFPEGFAIAVSALDTFRLGVIMCIAVAFHSIPEGIALAVSVYGVTKSCGQSFLWTFISGLTAPLGAICAMLLLQAYITSTPSLLHHLYVAVAGIMCYVALVELLPEAVSTRFYGMICIGFVMGVTLMLSTTWVIDFSLDASHVELRHRLLHGQMLY